MRPTATFLLDSVAVPLGVVLLASGVCFGWLLVLRRRERRRGRSPLADGMLRPPGHHLAGRVREADERFLMWVLAAVTIPAVFAMHTAARVRPGGTPAAAAISFGGTLTLAVIVFAAWRAGRAFSELIRLRRAHEAELVTAAELDRLMRDGWHVFHDLPDRRCGNIDHVILGEGGLYAVDTKSRLKPHTPDGHRVKVDPTAGTLGFPGWTERLPAETLHRQAGVLSKLIAERTGLTLPAEPLLALPGWWVEQVSRGTPRVMNPKTAAAFLKTPHLTRPLTAAEVKTAAACLDNLCRDVRPTLGREKLRA